MKGIIIAFPNEPFAMQIKGILLDYGMNVLHTCTQGSSVLNYSGNVTDVIVICPLILPDMPAHFLAEHLPASFDVLALSKNALPSSTLSNMTIMTLPLKKDSFITEVLRLCSISSYVSPDRKEKNGSSAELIDKAKKIIMKTKNLSESQAHRFFQRSCMNQGKKAVTVALEIIENNH